MSARPPLARAATELLAREAVAVGAPSPADGARALSAIALAIEETARARRRRRLVMGLVGGVAAAAALAFGVARERAHASLASVAPPPTTPSRGILQVTATGSAETGSTVVVRDARELPLDAAGPIGAGDRLVVAAKSMASLSLSTGTRVTLEDSTDVLVVEQSATETLALRAGAMRAHVEKLGAGQRFVIRTADAEVEVRGTSFRVATVASVASCGGGSLTRVSVTEGIVTVRTAQGEDYVVAGEVWPRGCGVALDTPPKSASRSESAPSSASARGSGRAGGQVGSVAPAPPAEPAAPSSSAGAEDSSLLASENRLFAEAIAAKRRGDHEAAIATFAQFVATYPSSKLAEDAAVERLRLLAASDRPRAREAAIDYLARYPDGFGRREAQALLGAP